MITLTSFLDLQMLRFLECQRILKISSHCADIPKDASLQENIEAADNNGLALYKLSGLHPRVIIVADSHPQGIDRSLNSISNYLRSQLCSGDRLLFEGPFPNGHIAGGLEILKGYVVSEIADILQERNINVACNDSPELQEENSRVLIENLAELSSHLASPDILESSAKRLMEMFYAREDHFVNGQFGMNSPHPSGITYQLIGIAHVADDYMLDQIAGNYAVFVPKGDKK